MHKHCAWGRFALWAMVLLPALHLGCSPHRTSGRVDGGSEPWPDPDPNPGPDAGTMPDGATSNCITLDEQPIAASPITWSGFPACDSAGFCVVYPAPMHKITSVATSPSGTNWVVYQNLVASWKGTQGKVVRFDIDYNADIADIFALSDTNVWIVGAGSTAVHYDGTRWTAATIPASGWLQSVWASSASDVWTVGNFGAIGHFNGISWSGSTPAGTSPDFHSVHGTGSRDVWTVGGGGLAEHYDGTRWTQINVGSSKVLWGVWAAAANDVFIVGESGLVLRGSIAAGFTQQTIPAIASNTTFRHVWGSSANDVWVTSDYSAIHFNGTTWTQVTGLQGVVRGRGASDIIAVDETQAQSFDGTNWKTIFSLKNPRWNAAWAASADDVWFVGEEGGIMRVKNGVMSRATLGTKDLHAVWGSSASDILITDSFGTLYRGDGKNFCATKLPTDGSTFYSEISGTGPNDIWINGQGEMLHYDGQSWMKSGMLYAQHIFAAAPNDVWAAGDALHHFNGSSWSEVIASTGFGSTFGAIWGAAPNDIWTSQDVFLGGDYALHWDGAKWNQVPDDGQTLGTLSGSASNDIWSFGFYHEHWDGTKWNYLQTTRLGIEASVATSREVWAVGDQGLVLRKTK